MSEPGRPSACGRARRLCIGGFSRRPTREINKPSQSSEGIGPPPYQAQAELGVQRKWAMKFAGDGNPMTKFLQLALLAPRYSFRDAWNFFSGVVASQNHFLGINMEGEFMKIDLTAGDMSFPMPIFVIQGTEDNLTPALLSRAFVEKLTAPQKAFIPNEGAGHMALCVTRTSS